MKIKEIKPLSKYENYVSKSSKHAGILRIWRHQQAKTRVPRLSMRFYTDIINATDVELAMIAYEYHAIQE